MKNYSLSTHGYSDKEAIIRSLQEIGETVRPGDYIGIGFEMTDSGSWQEVPTVARVISCRFQGTVSRLWSGAKAPDITLELSDGTRFDLSGTHPYVPYDAQRKMMEKLDTREFYSDIFPNGCDYYAKAILINVYDGAAEAEKALIRYNETLKVREAAKVRRAENQKKIMEEERRRESQAQYEAMKKAEEDARAARNLDNLFRGGTGSGSGAYTGSSGNTGSNGSYGSFGSTGSTGGTGSFGSGASSVPAEYQYMTCACGARLRYRKNRANVVVTCASCGREYKL